MTWRPVTEMLDGPDWFVAMYGLAAHRSHAAAEGHHKQLVRARDEALLLSLACAAAIRTSRCDEWPSELLELDDELFPPPDIPPAVPPEVATARSPVPERYRLRRLTPRVRERSQGRGARGDAPADPAGPRAPFLTFLEETVEPSALVLLAGLALAAHRTRRDGSASAILDPTAMSNNVPSWDRADVLGHLCAAVRDRSNLAARSLADGVAERPNLSGRSHYNLACFYAQVAEDDKDSREATLKRARAHLRAALAGTSGSSRGVMAAWARKDPTLRPAIARWAAADATLGPPPGDTAAAPSRSELGRINAIGGYAEALQGLGIRTAAALRRRTEPHGGISALAKALEADPDLVDRWAELVRVLDLEDIGVADLNLLNAAGISSVKELAGADPERLHDQLRQANKVHGWTERVPSVETLQAWIAQADGIVRP